jgi:hypothetical protein
MMVIAGSVVVPLWGDAASDNPPVIEAAIRQIAKSGERTAIMMDRSSKRYTQ